MGSACLEVKALPPQKHNNFYHISCCHQKLPCRWRSDNTIKIKVETFKSWLTGQMSLTSSLTSSQHMHFCKKSKTTEAQHHGEGKNKTHCLKKKKKSIFLSSFEYYNTPCTPTVKTGRNRSHIQPPVRLCRLHLLFLHDIRIATNGNENADEPGKSGIGIPEWNKLS